MINDKGYINDKGILMINARDPSRSYSFNISYNIMETELFSLENI